MQIGTANGIQTSQREIHNNVIPLLIIIDWIISKSMDIIQMNAQIEN